MEEMEELEGTEVEVDKEVLEVLVLEDLLQYILITQILEQISKIYH
jgi:hypothetical protein